MDAKEKIAQNIWDKNLDEVIAFVKEATADRFSGWRWPRNTRCKYIDIRIDMRDGAFVLSDRNGKRITFDELKWQYNGDADI